jgi:hypothetical protein
VVAFSAGDDPVISIQHPLAEEEHPSPEEETFRHGDTTFQRGESMDFTAFSFGGIPSEKRDQVTVTAYEDEDELAVLFVEDWDGYLEVRAGDFIHENELVLHRQRDEDEWEIKPPPRIDLRSLNEARREKQLDQQKQAEKQQKSDLEMAREKLAAFEGDEEIPEDPEDVVALSEIVDPAYRFAEEPVEEEPLAPAPETPPEPGPAFPFADEPEDPFEKEFGADEGFDPAPDPYMEYMETERDEEFADAFGVEDLPPLDPHSMGSADTPEDFLTAEKTDEFINAGVEEEDEFDQAP